MEWRNLPSGVRWTMVGVFGMLVTATIVISLMRPKSETQKEDELRKRVLSWWLMAIIFASAMVLSRLAAIVLFAFVSFLALKEFVSLIPTRRADHRPLFFAYLAIPLQYLWVYDEWYGVFI